MISIDNFELQSVDVESPGYAKDAAGGATQTWTVVTSNAVCNIQPQRGSRRKTFGSSQLYISHVAYFDSDPGARRGYRIKNRNTGVYYVIHSIENVAGRSELWSLDLVEQTSQ